MPAAHDVQEGVFVTIPAHYGSWAREVPPYSTPLIKKIFRLAAILVRGGSKDKSAD
jgi:hypothetical protein